MPSLEVPKHAIRRHTFKEIPGRMPDVIVPVWEVTSALDEPECPRDFDVDGSFLVLIRTLLTDLRENQEITEFVIRETDADLWSIWRIQ
jgi:hypothetical protein